MKLYKKTKLRLNAETPEAALERLSDLLYDDEEVVAFYEKGKKQFAFTNKRIIYCIRNEEKKFVRYYSYRNIASYGYKSKAKGELKIAFMPSVMAMKETATFTLKVTEENNNFEELCKFMGNLVW